MISKPYVLILKLTDKVDLRWGGKALFYQILVFIIHRKTWKAHTKMTFKISALTWNDKFELPNGSYSISDIQDNFDYILKNNENTNNSSIRIYVNKFENRITFKIKTKYYLELWTPETMKLHKSIWNKIKIKMLKMNHI